VLQPGSALGLNCPISSRASRGFFWVSVSTVLTDSAARTLRANLALPFPPERVFAALDDPAAASRWIPGLEAWEYEKPAVPRGVGSRLSLRLWEGVRTREFSGHISAYRPSGEWAVRVETPHLTLEISYRLTRTPEGTRLEQIVELTPRSRAARFLAPFGLWLLRRHQRRTLVRFRNLLAE
jgi:uncharacterized protein YndB with AHSA1/START domain